MLDDKGIRVPDISFAGGFTHEDHIFKSISLDAPYTKLASMGRAPMIPGFLGSNIEGVFKPEKRAGIYVHWEKLPPTVKDFGKYPEEIFAGWEPVKEKVGKDEMDNIPFGAIAMYAFIDKLSCGMQQFMAGARKFSMKELTRDDLLSANWETEEVTGIPYMLDAENEKALDILNA